MGYYFMKRWTVPTVDESKVRKIKSSTDLSALLSYVMAARGYESADSLVSFFNGEELSDPFRMKDMDKAVEAINEAVDNEELICIYGDYDCDGVTATAILYGYLSGMGANVMTYIPEREDGYGINTKAIDLLAREGVRLIVTVDNGITAIEESKYIAEKGIKLVVTDHHQPIDELPEALAIVDPHRPMDFSPFKQLCGAGVALKLCIALDGSPDLAMEMYSDLCAIGTIADIVPLVGENRTIVKQGIRQLANTENPGLSTLLEDSGVDLEKITAANLAFSVCPRINAAGRFSSPTVALDALILEDESAEILAHKLTTLNDARKQCEADILREVLSSIDANPSLLDERVLIVAGRNWHHGVIGIVAGRLLEKFDRPTVVLSIDGNGIARGSARSMPGFNIFKCFDYAKEVMVKYGGHECAGGLTLNESNVARFRELCAEYALKNNPSMPHLTITADKLLKGSDITVANVIDLRRLEPYGADNAEPIFALSGAVITAIIPLKNGDHTKLELNYEGVKLRALMFGTKTAELPYKQGEAIDIMATLSVNDYKGTRSVSLRITESRLHGLKQDRFFAAKDAYHAFKRGDKQSREVLAKGNPTRAELVAVYKYLMSLNRPVTEQNLYERVVGEHMNAFKLSVIIDAFCETGLAQNIPSEGVIRLVTPKERVDIESSETLKNLRLEIEK